MTTPIIRPVRRDDFDGVYALAQETGGGMTNLPNDADTLRARVDHAAASFEANATEPGGEVYLMVLELDGKLIGTTAVFSSIGLQSGFVNYKVNWTFHASEQFGKRIKRRLLVLTHDFTGAGEVGSLFLSPSARGGGLGKLLTRSRYLFIAQKPEIIADPVCAELRGWRGPDGRSPFWDALGRHFFEMEYHEADLHNSATGNQFIADLMPRTPIYVVLLPEAARDCIGKPFPQSEAAFALLKKEGFEYNDYVDIFDGGPLVSVKKNAITTIRDSRVKPIKVGAFSDGERKLLAAGATATFRATAADVLETDEAATISKGTAAALGVSDGDVLRCTDW